MPRVSVRRLFAYAIYTVVGTTLVMLAVHKNSPNSFWLRVLDQSSGSNEYQPNSKETELDDGSATNFVVLNDAGAIANSENVSVSALRRHGLPWYIQNDGYRPQPGDLIRNIWPGRLGDDRIEEQLMIPARPIDPGEDANGEPTPLKKIYLPNGLGSWQVKGGQKVFTEQKCPVDRCLLTSKKDDAASADAIMFKGDCLCALFYLIFATVHITLAARTKTSNLVDSVRTLLAKPLQQHGLPCTCSAQQNVMSKRFSSTLSCSLIQTRRPGHCRGKKVAVRYDSPNHFPSTNSL